MSIVVEVSNDFEAPVHNRPLINRICPKKYE